MSTKYHPDSRFLTDYAAGSLPPSQALCVAAHLHYCGDCRQKVRQLTSLGAVLFLQQEEAQPSRTESNPAALDNDFEQLMARIDSLPSPGQSQTRQQARQQTPNEAPGLTSLPPAIVKLAGGKLQNLKWYAMNKHFRFSPINLGDAQRETSLIHIRAGGTVTHHKHRGDELTVVLKGSFSDQDGYYQAGDFVVRTPGEAHKPVASQHEDCLCLATQDGPIVPTNLFYRLLAPLLNPRPVQLGS